MLDLARCAKCGTCFFVDEAAHEPYPEDPNALDNPDFQMLLYHYVELVGGLEWKIPLLERLPEGRIRSVLEIGCNMGLAIDYCRTMWGADVVGVEPSAYGRGGAKLLGVPILPKLLDDADELRDRTFDFVFATEVLEHVEDPRAFLRSMVRHLSSDGVVLISTPRAEHVHRSASAADLYATLSAGAHRFIPSDRALTALLADAGLEHRVHEVIGNSQMIFASRKPLELRDPPAFQPRIIEYARRLRRSDPRLALAANMEIHDSLAESASAAHPVAAIDEALARLFDVHLDRPLELEARLSSTKSIFEFGAIVPFGLVRHLLARGHCDRDQRDTMFALAAAVAVHGLRVDYPNLALYRSRLDHALEQLAQPRSLFFRTAVTRSLLERVEAARSSVSELKNARATPLSWVSTLLGARP